MPRQNPDSTTLRVNTPRVLSETALRTPLNEALEIANWIAENAYIVMRTAPTQPFVIGLHGFTLTILTHRNPASGHPDAWLAQPALELGFPAQQRSSASPGTNRASHPTPAGLRGMAARGRPRRTGDGDDGDDHRQPPSHPARHRRHDRLTRPA